MGSGFRDIGRYSKLPYLGMQLGHWPKCQKLHILYSLSTLGGQNWPYFFSTGSGFRDTGRFSVAHIASMYPKRLRFSLFLLYRQQFPRYSLIFKIATFGHEYWPLAKLSYFCSTGSSFQDTGRLLKLPYLGMKLGHWPKFHILPLCTPRGQIELIFALRAAVSEIRADVRNCHMWAWNLAIDQSARSGTYTLFLL